MSENKKTSDAQSAQDEHSSESTKKQTYTRPVLKHHEEISTLTLAGGGGANDGGGYS